MGQVAEETVYVGQFTDERADAIAGRLEAAGISWWYKQAGGIARTLFAGEWGTRLFVDAEHEQQARRIIEQTPGG